MYDKAIMLLGQHGNMSSLIDVEIRVKIDCKTSTKSSDRSVESVSELF